MWGGSSETRDQAGHSISGVSVQLKDPQPLPDTSSPSSSTAKLFVPEAVELSRDASTPGALTPELSPATRDGSATPKPSISAVDDEPPWHAMGFDGLEGFFTATRTVALADKELARSRAVLDGCSKATLEPLREGSANSRLITSRPSPNTSSKSLLGQVGAAASRRAGRAKAFLSFYGNPIDQLKSAPLFGEMSAAEFGLPRAVVLYLRFQLQAAGFFVIVFLLSLPHVIDSSQRNQLRNACRAELGAGRDANACGYDAFDVRPNIAPIPDGVTHVADLVMFGVLTWGLGACEEFAAGSNITEPVPGLDVRLFVKTPGSVTCSGSLTRIAYWCDFAITLLLLAGLIFLRWQARATAISDDAAVWTTGDYSVLLRGLDDGLDASVPEAQRRDADSLKLDLLKDMRDLGFGPETIKHIEVGRRCRAEVAVLRRLDRLNTRQHELAARISHRLTQEALKRVKQQQQQAEKGSDHEQYVPPRDEEAATAAAQHILPDGTVDVEQLLRRYTTAELSQSYMLTQQMETLVKDIDVLWDEPDFSTGHAYVVFQYESDRNAFLEQLNAVPGKPPTCALVSLHGSWPPVDAAHAKAMLPRTVSPRAEMPLEAVPAPEPSEVVWQNLELDDLVEARWIRRGAAVLVFVMLAGCVLTLLIRQAKSSHEQSSGPIEDANLHAVITFLLAIGTSVTVAGCNGLMKMLSLQLTLREGQDSQTEYEVSLFAKLSIAYLINSAAIPILVGGTFSLWVNGQVVDQSWYEAGGVLGQAWLLMLINAFAKDLLKILQPLPIIKRKLVTARSQKRLNQLWKPPSMVIGDLYASTLKTLALSLAYGPLYPLAYLWSVLAFLFCWACTRFGISRWFRKPPAVDETMTLNFCTGVTAIMFLQLGVQAAGCYSQGTSFADGLPVYVLSPLAWLCYIFAPLGRFSAAFRPTSVTSLGEDTDGVKFDDVRRLKNTEMQAYICPKLTKELVDTASAVLANLKEEQTSLLQLHGEDVFNDVVRKANAKSGLFGRSNQGNGGSAMDWIGNLLEA